MANTKRKPEEPLKRSPGKSKFVFPKREAPPVDNTYFDRLFSELQGTNLDADAPASVGLFAPPEEANRLIGSEELNDEVTALAQSTEVPSIAPHDKEHLPIHESSQTESLTQAPDGKPIHL